MRMGEVPPCGWVSHPHGGMAEEACHRQGTRRSELGHLEMDTVVGSGGLLALLDRREAASHRADGLRKAL